NIIVTDLLALYDNHNAGKPAALPELEVQYAEFAASQRERLNTPASTADLDYWKAHLAGAAALLAWPTDKPRPAVESHRGARHALSLNHSLTNALRRLSHQEKTSLLETLLASFQT